MKLKELIFDRSLLFYTIIGISNTLLTMGLEFLLNNAFGLPYWWTTSIPFAITSVTSFVFNRRFSFKSKGNLWLDMVKFYLLFIACYFVAFYVAKPISIQILNNTRAAEKAVNNISIIIGQCVFTPLNYFGQRFWVYRKKETPQVQADEAAEE